MKYVLRFLVALGKIAVLTILTQVGGLVYILYLPLRRFLKKRFTKQAPQLLYRWASFSLLYILVIGFIVPPIARQFGRVPLPWWSSTTQPIKAHNILVSPLLNRHYVKPELKNIVLEIAQQMQSEHEQLTLTYLDANFPFHDGFPLLPHLSHDDGEKLDIAFIYKYNDTGGIAPRNYGFLGYGRCDGPQDGEWDFPASCRKKGKWLYDGMALLQPQKTNGNLQADPLLNKMLLNLLSRKRGIRRIFLEPHLELRWLGRDIDKIRPAGCHAVRHDDHIHVQL